MFRISKTFEFHAAHRMPQLPVGHPCRNLHGHNFRVEVVLRAEQLDGRGFAGADFSDLDEFGAYLRHRFEGHDGPLNDLAPFVEQAPTSERLALHFFRWCRERWPGTERVRVYETDRVWAEYSDDLLPRHP